MIEVVINYSQEDQTFRVYEPTTDTLLISSSLTEALVNLSNFLMQEGMIQGDILNYPEISYHLDSFTVKAMVESNVNLMKRLQTAPSGFMLSSQKFGGTSTPSSSLKKRDRGGNNGFEDSGFSKSYKKEAYSKRFSNSKKSSSFSGKSGFKAANKKFGTN